MQRWPAQAETRHCADCNSCLLCDVVLQSQQSIRAMSHGFGLQRDWSQIGRDPSSALQKMQFVLQKRRKACLVIEQAVAEGHDAAASWLQHSIDLCKHLLRLQSTLYASEQKLYLTLRT